VQDIRRNTMIGAFVIVGLAALSWLMTSFGEMPAFLGGNEYEIRIAVKQPSGIGQGAPINLSGVQVGRVKELRFKDREHLDSGVLIIGAIDDEFKIPNTATAMVHPAGLGLGRGYIDIQVVEGEKAPALRPGEEISGIMTDYFEGVIPPALLSTFGRTVTRFGDFLEEITPVADDLHDLLDKHTVTDVDREATDLRHLAANVYTVVQRFDTTLKTFNATFGDPEMRQGVLDMIANVRQMSVDGKEAFANIRTTSVDLKASLDRIAAQIETGIKNTNAHLDQISLDIQPVLHNAAKLAALLVEITQSIEHGEGTAGRLINDPRLYESLLLTSQRLTDLVDTIQRLMATFERNGQIKLDVPIGLFRHTTIIKIPDASAKP